jgi:hypothetical protein
MEKLFEDPSNKDILAYLKPFLGRKGIRELGVASKTIYNNLGGKEQADKDLMAIKILEIELAVQNLLEKLRSLPFDIFKDKMTMALWLLEFDLKLKEPLIKYLRSNYTDNSDFYEKVHKKDK